MSRTASVSLESIETDFSTELIEIELPGGTRGLQGPQGIQGEVGETPEFHIGTVVDSENAEATITGTEKEPVLNLGLPRGKSGVWVGETAPDNEQYNVWINPEATGSTIPTKVSDLTNDVGYITTTDIPKDVYSYQETLTNKVYIDENNVQLPVYRKMLIINPEDIEVIHIGQYDEYVIEHGIANLNNITSSIEYSFIDDSGFKVTQNQNAYVYNQYLEVGFAEYPGILTMEYTKTS